MSEMILIDKINKKQINPNVPNFQVGDTVRVDVKIIEGKRERIQAFEKSFRSRTGNCMRFPRCKGLYAIL